jgi:hypothetical protein
MKGLGNCLLFEDLLMSEKLTNVVDVVGVDVIVGFNLKSDRKCLIGYTQRGCFPWQARDLTTSSIFNYLRS